MDEKLKRRAWFVCERPRGALNAQDISFRDATGICLFLLNRGHIRQVVTTLISYQKADELLAEIAKRLPQRQSSNPRRTLNLLINCIMRRFQTEKAESLLLTPAGFGKAFDDPDSRHQIMRHWSRSRAITRKDSPLYHAIDPGLYARERQRLRETGANPRPAWQESYRKQSAAR